MNSQASGPRVIFLFMVLVLVIGTPLAWPLDHNTGDQQQSTQQQHEPWDLGVRQPNWTGNSNLTIENRCKGNHQFEVAPTDLPFAQFLVPTHNISVAGHKTKDLPVKFDTTGMQAGEYNGQVVVRCLDCPREPSCTQDREFVPVHLTIAQQNQPTTPGQPGNPTQPRTPEPATQPMSLPAPQKGPLASTMDDRIRQVVGALTASDSCETAQQVIDEGMEVLYGGLRPLPTKGEALEMTTEADRMLAGAEGEFAAALGQYAVQGKCPKQRGRALDLKLFVEQMNEVARAAGAITKECGENDPITGPRAGKCAQLQPMITVDKPPGAVPAGPPLIAIGRSFSVPLRSPSVPPWFSQAQEDVRVTAPIPQGECVVVFKETKGLMVRLHFEGMTIVRDPWANAKLARGTIVPIWALEWVPSEYVKEWNICNTGRKPDGGMIEKTVTQRVVEDVPLNFFWRFYPKDP